MMKHRAQPGAIADRGARSLPRAQRTHPIRRRSARLRARTRPARAVRFGTLALSSERTSTAASDVPAAPASSRAVRTARSRPSSIASAQRERDRNECADEAETALARPPPPGPAARSAGIPSRPARCPRNRRRPSRRAPATRERCWPSSRIRARPTSMGHWRRGSQKVALPAARGVVRVARGLHLAPRRHFGDRHVPPRVVAADARLAIDRHDDDGWPSARSAARRARRGATRACRRARRARRATPRWPRDRPAAHRRRARSLPALR